jgi:hypothetical protein
MRVRRVLAVLPLVLAVVACGASTTTGSPAAAPAAAPDTATVAAGSPTDDGCPLAAADLSSATSLAWELRQTLTDHPLETLESVKATVCVFTAADSPQIGGDPLVLRVDTVTGADAAALRTNFQQNCTGNRGAVEESSAADGAAVCRRDGAVVQGNIAGDGRTVDVYLVNARTDTATSLTPSFDKVLAAVG